MNKNRRARLALLSAAACLLTTSAASAQGAGTLLWEDTVDVGTFDQAFDVAAVGDRVFAAGFVGDFGRPFGSNRDFFIRAYDAHEGTLLWQDRVDKGPNDFASGVVAAGGRVFVAGAAGSGRFPDWLVRAYDAETGQPLWEDRFDRSGGSDLPRPGGLAASEGLLFVAGSADSVSVWVVRAYDQVTGALVWEDQFDSPGFTFAQSIAVSPGRVFVGGGSDTDVSGDVLVRAYAVSTGELIWEHRTPGPLSCCTTMNGLGTDGSRVFAGGSVANASGKNDFLVQAYDSGTGALLWRDQVDNGGEVDSASQIAVLGGRVFAAGQGGQGCLLAAAPPSDCDSLVRSYDAATGGLLWDQKIDVGPRTDDFASAVDVATGALFLASGVGWTRAVGGDWLIQAYDSSTGQVLWDDLVDTGGGGEEPLDLAFLDGRVFVAGRTVVGILLLGSPASGFVGNWNFVVRAYDTGNR